MIIVRALALCTACSLALLLAACGGEEKKVVAPAHPAPPPTSETTITSAPAPATRPVSPSIAASEDILRACSLHLDDLGTAPKFELDKSELLPADHEILGQIGRCLTTGPLQGRTIRLVGRADPRGPEQYNLALGAHRAHSVSRFLELLGVEIGRMRETTRGELDAIGTDEATWQLDRRVDIVLAE